MGIAIPIIQSLFSPLEFQKLVKRVVRVYINQHWEKKSTYKRKKRIFMLAPSPISSFSWSSGVEG